MDKKVKEPIRIDLNQFKLHINFKKKLELTLHFNSPSRRFYLSVISLVVNEMKKLGRITSILLKENLDLLVLLNETVGGSAGASNKENLLPRIYRKWKDALPDLEDARLFKVLGRKKEYGDGIAKIYRFTEREKDSWANLFEYKGSEEHVRLRFSIDKLGVTLNDIVMVYGEDPELINADAWEKFTSSLKKEKGDRPKPGPETPASQLRKNTAFLLPDKPSIAVLPFDNMSDDPAQGYLSDGITENIITALSKIPEIFVIARHSTFMYKGKAVKVQKVSEELRVRHVLEGSVQKSGGRVRISVQLVDATNGYHLWAEQYDRDIQEFFALQDEITHKVVVALQVELTEGEQALVRHRSTNNLRAWGYAVRGYSLFERYNKEDNIKARELFGQAVKLDPEYAWAWTWLAFTHWTDARFGFSKSRSDSFERAVELAQKAISLDESDPDAHSLLGFISLFQKQHEKAIAEGEKSIAFGPNNAESHAHFAVTMFHAGRFEEAIGLCMKAMRLSPHYPSWYLVAFGAPNLFLGRYEEAIDAFESCIERSEKQGGAIQILANCYLAAAYSELGRLKEARARASEVFNINPDFSLEWVRESAFSRDPAQLERLLEALRTAGLK